MKLYPIVKRVTNVISGGVVNARFQIRSGTKASWVATLLTAVQKPATQVRWAPSTLIPFKPKAGTRASLLASGLAKFQQAPGTKQTWSPATLVAAKPVAATRVGYSPARLVAAKQRPALECEFAGIDLSHASHIVTATQDVGGTATWTNPTNAQGAPQGTRAGSSSFDGQLLLSTGKLRGTMVAQANRPPGLTITRVDLDFYGEGTGLPAVDDLFTHFAVGYRVNTAPVAGIDGDLHVMRAGNVNFLATPLSFRIDNGAGAFTDLGATAVTWANIALIQPYFNGAIIANLQTCHFYADAVRLRVTAREEPA